MLPSLALLAATGLAVGLPAALAHAARASLHCSPVLIVDSRGSGETGLSPPGDAFAAALRTMVGSGVLAIEPNPYPAVGIAPSLEEAEQSLIPTVGGVKAELKALQEAFNGIGADPRLARLKEVGAYNASLGDGVDRLTREIESRSGACPDEKLVLTGYSQGAEVAGNVFSSLPPSLRTHVLAVVLFGDPLYNHRSYADEQRLGEDGILGTRREFPRGRTTVLSYCHAKDPICQGYLEGIHGLSAHAYAATGEPEKAAARVASLIGAAASPPSSAVCDFGSGGACGQLYWYPPGGCTDPNGGCAFATSGPAAAVWTSKPTIDGTTVTLGQFRAPSACRPVAYPYGGVDGWWHTVSFHDWQCGAQVVETDFLAWLVTPGDMQCALPSNNGDWGTGAVQFQVPAAWGGKLELMPELTTSIGTAGHSRSLWQALAYERASAVLPLQGSADGCAALGLPETRTT